MSDLFDACEKGDFNRVKELFEQGVDMNIYDNYAFRKTCTNGHFEMAKWIYKYGNVDIYSINSGHYNVLCCEVCKNNHLNIAKWLYDLRRLDNGSNYNTLFHIVSRYSNLKTLQWLYEKEHKNIDVYDDYLLRNSLRNKNNGIEIAKWIYSKYDKSEIFESEEYCKIEQIVKEEKENYVNGFIMFLSHSDIINDVLLDIDVFIIELPKYLFYEFN